jgi:hypothetical protein
MTINEFEAITNYRLLVFEHWDFPEIHLLKDGKFVKDYHLELDLNQLVQSFPLKDNKVF